MFTNLEKVESNFPDIAFERRFNGLGGYRAFIPHVYESAVYQPFLQRDFGACTSKVNACLSKMGVRQRSPFILKPLTGKGRDKDECATDIIEKIRSLSIKRHFIKEGSEASPDKKIAYYPVFKSDPFHVHGDPDFIDMFPINCKDGEEFLFETMVGDVEINVGNLDSLEGLLKIVTSAMFDPPPSIWDDVDPANFTLYSQRDVVTFDINYGDNHSHFVDAETLASKLKL